MILLKKALVIVYCLSFIGMTVSPSSAIPCCCKTRTPSSTSDDFSDADQPPPSDSCCAARRAQPQNCCAQHAPIESHCSFTKTTNLNCGHCSCLKHLQLIGISENLGADRVEKSDSLLGVLVDRFVTTTACHQTVLEESAISSLDHTFILHCSLRI